MQTNNNQKRSIFPPSDQNSFEFDREVSTENFGSQGFDPNHTPESQANSPPALQVEAGELSQRGSIDCSPELQAKIIRSHET